MCTASWFITNQQLQLTFNRDEKKTRSDALPPQLRVIDGIKTLQPTDPDAGGTWMSVNEAGIIVCLLNNYRDTSSTTPITTPTSTPWTSRGKLVQQLATLTSHQAIDAELARQTLSQYQPFHLIILSLEQQMLFNWNGKQLTEGIAPAFLTSSGFDTTGVLAGRAQQFIASNIDSTQAALAFHASHQPQKGAYSICMHRIDASSTSLNHITVDKNTVSFSYWPGSPCVALTTNNPDKIVLPRTAE